MFALRMKFGSIFALLILVYASSCSSVSPLKASEPTAALPLVTPESLEPASGICADFEGPLATVSLMPDIPSPRCARVTPTQHLKVVNDTDQTWHISLGGREAQLKPGESYTFPEELNSFLAYGVHHLVVSPEAEGAVQVSAEIWLVQEKNP